MIIAHDLTKTFKDKKRGVITAVDHVSFTAGAGAVVGFGAPPGAGAGAQPSASANISTASIAKRTTRRSHSTLIRPP